MRVSEIEGFLEWPDSLNSEGGDKARPSLNMTGMHLARASKISQYKVDAKSELTASTSSLGMRVTNQVYEKASSCSETCLFQT